MLSRRRADCIRPDKTFVGRRQTPIRQLDIAATRGQLLINDAIYAELAIGYTRVEAVEERVREAA